VRICKNFTYFIVNTKWQHVDTQNGDPKGARLIVSTCVGRTDILFANQDAHDPTAEHQDVIPVVSNDGPDATPDVILDANKENLAAIQEEDPVSTKAGDVPIQAQENGSVTIQWRPLRLQVEQEPLQR